MTQSNLNFNGTEIAIIGMNGRFPGAPDLDIFWRNLRDGVESIHYFSDEELRQAGLDEATINDPDYVKAAAFLDDPDLFDASFFSISHREAEITDPQQRVLLECAWSALEHAGYNPQTYPGAISVYAGATMNTYLLLNLAANPQAIANLEPVQLNIGNAGDFLATRIAYKLNLRGASYTIQSACSTSLVAVHVACEALLNEECDMALAGGASVNISFQHGYRYVTGGIASPDGHCRPFDANAQGTIFGNGAGIVVLKRLADALADGDTIQAVIKGTAVNNDGSFKVGYTAPSVEGQAQVIAEALANAGVGADSISYMEAHGTATPLGDPIEIQALTKAFQAHTAATGFCALGAVKSNIGHLDAAAGIAGLIKTVLALNHKQLPPSLHYKRPNPNINFAQSPFYVNTALAEWRPQNGYRRAGVSAFGVGGTNAHVVLEEAPTPKPPSPSRPWQLLPLSAKTETAVTQMVSNLGSALQANPDLNLANVAYTLQTGRQTFAQRRLVLASNISEAISTLNDQERQLRGTSSTDGKQRPLVFMFTGQGAQYQNMGRDLYKQEPLFRHTLDQCDEILQPHLGVSILSLLYPDNDRHPAGDITYTLDDTIYTQPILFAVEYALAQLFYTWGIEPQALVGHSIGEYVAACLAGVFTLADALKLVALRGRLMQELPGGAMLAVPLSEFEIEPFLNDSLAIAAVNGPSRCVVAGPVEAVEQLAQQFNREEIAARPLHTSHAFHSPMMDPILATFTEEVSQITLHPPQIPLLSNISGTWMTAEEATDPRYWTNHLRRSIRFTDNLAELLADDQRMLVELGPGEMLSRLARRHPDYKPGQVVMAALRHPHSDQNDQAVALKALGQLWLAGIEPDWTGFYGQEQRQRIPLPTYAFARQRYWIDGHQSEKSPAPTPTDARQSIDDWFYLPTWQRTLRHRFNLEQLTTQPRCWLIFADDQGVTTQLHQTLTKLGQTVTIVQAGNQFSCEENRYTLHPAQGQDYITLVQELHQQGILPEVVLHLWSLNPTLDSASFDEVQAHGYDSLIYFVQAMAANITVEPAFELLIVTDQVFALTAQESLRPEKATLLGLSKVMPQEYEQIHCQVLDITGTAVERLTEPILAAANQRPDKPMAYRRGQWWEQTYQSVFAPTPASNAPAWRKNGVYLFTGGLLEIGIEMATHLAQTVQPRLILLEEAPFPPADQWDEWVATQPSNHPTSEKITRARSLIASGAEVWVSAIEWADNEQEQTAVTQALARFGNINGVIYNARVLGERSFRTIAETGPIESAWQFKPKVLGLIHLAQALVGQTLDFCVLNSSLSSVLGGLGMAAYAAANSFMDAFAYRENQVHDGVWISINWDAWQHTQVSTVSASWAKNALTQSEGIVALERILSLDGVERIVISTVDLSTRIEQAQYQPTANNETLANNGRQIRYARPELPTPYIPPNNEREQLIADIWQQTLGLEKIGVLDNFFDLGGDSLLAIQTVKQLKNSFTRDIPVAALYEGVTIRALAKLLDDLEQEPDETAVQEMDKLKYEREARISRRRQVQQRQRLKRQKP